MTHECIDHPTGQEGQDDDAQELQDPEGDLDFDEEPDHLKDPHSVEGVQDRRNKEKLSHLDTPFGGIGEKRADDSELHSIAQKTTFVNIKSLLFR